MTSTTWTSDAWERTRRTNRVAYIHYWLSIFGLATADCLSFLLVDLFIRSSHSVPTIGVFLGRANAGDPTPINVFAVLCMLFVVLRYLSGDYSRRHLFWDGAKVTTIALLVISLPDFAMLFVGLDVYSVWPVLLSWVALIFILPTMRHLFRLLMGRMNIWQIPTAIIGFNSRSAEILKALRSSQSLGFDVRWLVLENSETPQTLDTLKTVHAPDATVAAATICLEGCREAIIAAEDMQSDHFTEVVQRLLEANVSVAIIPPRNRIPMPTPTTTYFFGSDILMMQVRSNAQRLPWRIVKRTFDVVVSIIFLVLLSPLFLALAVAIKRDGAGPVFYSQRRVGRHGVQFQCLKFRTMAPNADAILERWKSDNPELYKEFLVSFKLRDDPRITGVGKWLRKTSLDELPQLLNVLRGDMSLVGPRPIPEQQLRDQYGTAAQLYVRVRPGMSGLWQISGRSETTGDQRVILDQWYILNWSFWYDIVILIETARIVVTGKGAF